MSVTSVISNLVISTWYSFDIYLVMFLFNLYLVMLCCTISLVMLHGTISLIIFFSNLNLVMTFAKNAYLVIVFGDRILGRYSPYVMRCIIAPIILRVSWKTLKEDQAVVLVRCCAIWLCCLTHITCIPPKEGFSLTLSSPTKDLIILSQKGHGHDLKWTFSCFIFPFFNVCKH